MQQVESTFTMAKTKAAQLPELPKVSIIVLNWNSYEVTRDCLLSLRSIDYSNREILLVDNGSFDCSGEQLAREFPEVRLLRNRENLGFTGGNNVAICDALERGTDYLLLLNNDTVVDRSFLSELIRAGENDPQIGLLNPKIYYFQPPDRIWYAGGVSKPGRVFPIHVGLRESDNGSYNQPREVSFLTGCALLVKAGVVRRIGLLDEIFFMNFEDADWSVRALQAGFKGFYVPSAIVWHRDAYVTRTNLGSHARDFYTMRNTILFARKHAKAHHWPMFVISVSKYLLYRTVVGICKADIKSVRALYSGIWNGCSTRIPVQSSVHSIPWTA
jgi:GT2 family glycosyltransferase